MYLVSKDYCDYVDSSSSPLYVVDTQEEAEMLIEFMRDEIKQVAEFYKEWYQYSGENRIDKSRDCNWKENTLKLHKEYQKLQKEWLEKARGIFEYFPGILKYGEEEHVRLWIEDDNHTFGIEKVEHIKL